MAAFLPDTRALLLLVLVAPAVLSAASPRALPRGTDAERVIKIEADSQELDFNSNHVLFRKITISQGATRISADEAEGDGPEMKVNDSRWQLRGNVRMTFDTGVLESDRATISFQGNRIARADAHGEPAKFEQKIQKVQKPARGEAGNIDYDVLAGRVTLTGGAWFIINRSEYRSGALVYNVREQSMQSGGKTAPANGGRIEMTIRPDEEPGATAEPPPP